MATHLHAAPHRIFCVPRLARHPFDVWVFACYICLASACCSCSHAALSRTNQTLYAGDNRVIVRGQDGLKLCAMRRDCFAWTMAAVLLWIVRRWSFASFEITALCKGIYEVPLADRIWVSCDSWRRQSRGGMTGQIGFWLFMFDCRGQFVKHMLLQY